METSPILLFLTLIQQRLGPVKNRRNKSGKIEIKETLIISLIIIITKKTSI